MEGNETQEISQKEAEDASETPITMPAIARPSEKTVASQEDYGTCVTCGAAQVALGKESQGYVYAFGSIEPRFPSGGIEKEYQQVRKALMAQLEQELKNAPRGSQGQLQEKHTKLTQGTDHEAFVVVLSERNNRYLCRQLCWVMSIEKLETYILHPRDPGDFYLLVEALRTHPKDTDIDLVIGNRGPIAPPELCNGLMIPIVVFDQIYSFPMDSIIQSIPQPTPKIPDKQFRELCEETFEKIMHIADNAGATDEHRALNYLAVRCPEIYQQTAKMFHAENSLAVTCRPSRLSGARKVVDAIFAYTNRKTDFTERYFIRVDVTDEFPFLASKLTPYYVYDHYA